MKFLVNTNVIRNKIFPTVLIVLIVKNDCKPIQLTIINIYLMSASRLKLRNVVV